MAIPILNHLDLRSVSELRNAILHKTSSGSATHAAGKIIYDSGAVKVSDGSAWFDLSGDIKQVKVIADSGDYDVTNGNFVLTISGDTGITTSITSSTLSIDLDDTSTDMTATNSGVYGSSTAIPVITVDRQGRLTNATTTSISTSFTIKDDDDDDLVIDMGKEIKFLGDGIGIDWTDIDTGNDTDPYDLTFTNTDKGSGQNIFKTVAIKPSHSGTTTYASTRDLTADSNNDTLKVFDGDGIDVVGAAEDDIMKISVDNTVVRTSGAQTIAGTKTFSNEVIINGNLTVSGTQTTKASETVLIEDNIITLNSNETGSASENAGIEIERGSDTNVLLRWTEGSDRWQFTNDGSTYYNIPIPSEYDNFNFSVKALNGSGNLTTQEVADGGVVTFTAGQVASTDGIDVVISGDDTITISHHDTSSQASVNNTGRTYIQDITLDTYGHITAITSATESVVDTNTQLVTKSALIDVSVMDDTATHRAASIAHNMDSEKIMVQLFDISTGGVVFADIVHVDENTVKITFASIPTNDIRVLMIDLKDTLSDLTPTYSNS